MGILHSHDPEDRRMSEPPPIGAFAPVPGNDLPVAAPFWERAVSEQAVRAFAAW
jgi:hypothetical protein